MSVLKYMLNSNYQVPKAKNKYILQYVDNTAVDGLHGYNQTLEAIQSKPPTLYSFPQQCFLPMDFL